MRRLGSYVVYKREDTTCDEAAQFAGSC